MTLQIKFDFLTCSPISCVNVAFDHCFLNALVEVDFWLLQVAVDKFEHAGIILAKVARIGLENLGQVYLAVH